MRLQSAEPRRHGFEPFARVVNVQMMAAAREHVHGPVGSAGRGGKGEVQRNVVVVARVQHHDGRLDGMSQFVKGRGARR